MSEGVDPEVTLGTLHQDLGEVRSDLREVKTDLREFKTDMRELKTDLSEVKTDIREIKTDIREVKTDMREVKALLATRLPAPDWPGEMLRTLRENTQLSRENTQLLRENNRVSEARFAQLDVTLREQAIETHTILRALGEGQRQLAAEIRALIVRIDALIRGRGDGSLAG